MEYRRSKDHGNADALSRLPFSNDTSFDGEEMEDDVDSVCLVRTISRQINPDNPLLVVRETAKDPILSQLMRFVKEGWPHAFSEELKDFKKLENSLSTENGCVFYGLRVIIPSTLRNHILKLLHLGHFAMQRMVKTPLGPCDQLSGKKLVSPCRRLFKISLHSSNNLNVFEKYYCYT